MYSRVVPDVRHHGHVLHLRINSPSEHTAAIEALVRDHPGVVDLVVIPGACIEPVGDVITLDVVRDEADAIIGQLRALGVDQRGSIIVQQPTLVISQEAAKAEKRFAGSPLDAVVWEEVRRRTSEDASLSITYVVFMVAAMFIAAIGIMSDSSILIVAAMVVGPDFGPTAATAVGIATRRWGVARTAFGTLLIGFGIGIVATAVFTALLNWLGLFGPNDVLGPRPQTSFIFQPGWPSLIVAMIAGVIGILSLTTAKSGALIGVFISVTTIPAASNVGVAIVFGAWSEAWGSLAQLGVNILGIQVAAALTLLAQRRWMHPQRRLTQGIGALDQSGL